MPKRTRLAATSQDAASWAALGRAELAAGRPDAAASALLTAVAIDAGCEAAGASLRAALPPDQFEAVANDAIARLPEGGSPWAARALAEARASSGDFAGALPLLQSALKADPGHQQTWAAAGRAYASLGKAAAASKCLNRAVELDPLDEASGEQLSQLLQSSGDAAAEEAMLASALAARPAAAWAASRLAALRWASGRPEEALAPLQARFLPLCCFHRQRSASRHIRSPSFASQTWLGY